MPKVLVLFDEADEGAEVIGESAADGARGVRFTEVDVRVATAAGTSVSRRRTLESTSDVDQYDAVIVAAGNNSTTSPIGGGLDALGRTRRERFVNMVFGAARSDDGELAGQLASLGGIVVSMAENRDIEVAARELGARAAKLAAWVRHSLGHEHADREHGHEHDPDRADHQHGHRHAH